MRIQSIGTMRVFWAAPGEAFIGNSVTVPLTHDAQWRTLEAALPPTGTVDRLRFDPGTAIGAADVDWVRVYDASGTTLLREWDFGGPAGGSPFEPYNPHEGWTALNDVTLEDLPGFVRMTAQGVGPFAGSPTFGSHPGPIRAEIRSRSVPENAGRIGRFMWVNSEGNWGVAVGRGMNFPLVHSGEWELYTLDVATPDVSRVRLDPFSPTAGGPLVEAGMVLDVDFIRILSDEPGRSGEVLEEWDFGGHLPGSDVGGWQLFEHQARP
jgi:hypothetical protein